MDTLEIEESPQEQEPLQLHIRDRSNQIMSQPSIPPDLSRSVVIPSPNLEYPNLSAKQFMQLLVVGAIFLSPGYMVAHYFFANTLIALFAKSSDPTSTAQHNCSRPVGLAAISVRFLGSSRFRPIAGLRSAVQTAVGVGFSGSRWTIRRMPATRTTWMRVPLGSDSDSSASSADHSSPFTCTVPVGLSSLRV